MFRLLCVLSEVVSKRKGTSQVLGLVLLCCCVGCGSAPPESAEKFNEAEAQARLDNLVEVRTKEIMENPTLSEEEKQKEIEDFKRFAKSQMSQVRQVNEAIEFGSAQSNDERDAQERQ